MKINIIDNFQSETIPQQNQVQQETSTSFKFNIVDEYIGNVPIDPNLLYKHYDPAYYWNLPFEAHIIDDFGVLTYAYSLATEDGYILMAEGDDSDTVLIMELI